MRNRKESIAEFIRRKRDEWGVTQEEFGDLVGLSGKYISAIENDRPIPDRTERQIRQAAEDGPEGVDQRTKLAKLRRQHQYDLSSWAHDSRGIFKEELQTQADGTKTFICSCSGLLEDEDPDLLYDLFTALKKQTRSEFYYCYPEPGCWPELEGIPQLEAGRALTHAAAERLKDKILRFGLDSDALARIKPCSFRHSHLFHPFIKVIMYMHPVSRERTRTVQQKGWLEFKTPWGPHYVPMESQDVVTGLGWLNDNGVDITPIVI